jgi:hypothetical protein
MECDPSECKCRLAAPVRIGMLSAALRALLAASHLGVTFILELRIVRQTAGHLLHHAAELGRFLS